LAKTDEQRPYRLLDRAIRPVAYVSLFAIALALMRWGHFEALHEGKSNFAEAWT